MPEFIDGLTAEQKPLFEAEVKKVKDAAVAEYKTAAEAERKKTIPEKYELKFSEKSPLDSEKDAVKIAAYAKAQGLTAEQAGALVKHHEEVTADFVARQQQRAQSMADEWLGQVKKDKDLGGEHFDETNTLIKRVIDKFLPDENAPLRKLLNDSGYGNHPEWVRFVVSIGKAMAEDNTINPGGSATGKPKEDWEVIYGAK